MRNAFRVGIVALGAATVLLSLLTSAADAHWLPGNPVKMTVPQLPDPSGLDIDMRLNRVLADDWKCSETGPVSDVHFWVSIQGNTGTDPNPGLVALQQQLNGVYVSFHENVPAIETQPSHPGALIRGYVVPAAQVSIVSAGNGTQGWYDPTAGQYIADDHAWYYQINIPTLPDPFIQQQGQIYWLDLSLDTSLAVGWKTSLSQFDNRPPLGMDDDAVWGTRSVSEPFGPVVWESLIYPLGDPRYPNSLNLAFVITPEPGSTSLLLAAMSLAGLKRRLSR